MISLIKRVEVYYIMYFKGMKSILKILKKDMIKFSMFPMITNLLLMGMIFQSFIGLSQHRDNNEYYQSRNSLFIVLPDTQGEIVFLGDDLIADCPWAELLEDPRIKNRGIRGEVIAGVKKRIHHVLRSEPSKIFLMIGINDLRDKSDVDILNEYYELVKHITTKAPDTELYLQSILPTRGHARYNNTDIVYVNERIRTMAAEFGATYVDLHYLFIDTSGQLDRKYSQDGFHLNGPGYMVWGEAVKELVRSNTNTMYESGTSGASLQMAGWVWDSKPDPKDNSDETGKIVYMITIDDEGYITNISLQSSTVTPAVERLYRQSVERLSFSKTSEYKPAPTSSGTITFLIQTK